MPDGQDEGLKAEDDSWNEELVAKPRDVLDEAEPDDYLQMEERVREVSNFQDIWKHSGLRSFL